jgi:hypothetical protein
MEHYFSAAFRGSHRLVALNGFNEGRIEFQGGHAGPRKGNVTLETVLRTLIERESKL